MWDMSHSYVWHDSPIRSDYECTHDLMSHWWVWRDSFSFWTWLNYMRDLTHSYVGIMSAHMISCGICVCVTWLILIWDMTHLYVWPDTLIRSDYECTRISCRICVCDMTHFDVGHDLLMCDMSHPYVGITSAHEVSCRMCVCDMTHSDAGHDSLICVTWHTHT